MEVWREACCWMREVSNVDGVFFESRRLKCKQTPVLSIIETLILRPGVIAG
jgi:hypothetical protein